MPKRTRHAHLYEFAKRGAEVQLRELLDEARLLMRLFPHLRDSFDNDELPLSFIMAKGSGAATRKTQGRGRGVSAARGASGAWMKKYRASKRGAVKKS